MVRRPEQNTGPNVHYLGAHAASLEPGTAHEPEMWLWSDRRLPPPELPEDDQERFYQKDVRTVLDVDHQVHWGPKVAAYLVTKGIAAGASLWAPFLGAMAAAGTFARDWLPELLALLFTGVTTLLLVADLHRPRKFFSLLLRPNTKSWLVRGAWVLIAFSSLSAAILAARVLGLHEFADGLRWTNLVTASLAAAYTAFLFAQCEGRDLWQNTRVLLPHLIVQALLVGGLVLLAFVTDARLAWFLFATALVHHGLGFLERFGRHGTHNARMAAALMPTVKAWTGSRIPAFHVGLALSTGAALWALLLVLADLGHPAPLLACAALASLGLYAYEHAYVRAGQLPPLS